MAKGITELVNDFKILHPMAYQKIYNKAIVDCLTIIKTNHMIRTMEDDFCSDIEVPFYRKLFESVKDLKGGAENEPSV